MMILIIIIDWFFIRLLDILRVTKNVEDALPGTAALCLKEMKTQAEVTNLFIETLWETFFR
jgi:hypothetical protein